MSLAAALMLLLAAYLIVYVSYQALLFAANALVPDPADSTPATFRRIAVLVPAHNEELHLGRLLGTLTRQDYPADRFRVVVIADNCSDATASTARRFGVQVEERTDHERRGKGYAIGWALDRLDLDSIDAMVVVDGDSLVRPDFLKHLNLQLERGDEVIQCYNGVANPGQSWFTRLMNVSRTIANEILHPGKRKLGLSSHLMGNGMCFATPIIRRFGWNAFTVGEDWEYYARLILSGAHVGYSRDARVYHQESVNLRQASSQRLRWSGGRFQILRRYGPALFVQGIRTGSLKCLDASLPLLLPNPSLGMNLTVLGFTASALAWFMTGERLLAAVYSSLLAIQLIMFLVGVMHTHDRMASALSLFLAPAFLVWKLGIDVLSLTGVGTKGWKPTERKI
jgi:cellulose synthase/poly-beta-1,6-N-acetylglucosamine synthase-like glycosyltransferase